MKIKVYLILILFCSFSMRNLYSQTDQLPDSVNCIIYITVGFEKETLQLYIDDQIIFEDIYIEKSNPYFGLTGIEVWLLKNHKVLLCSTLNSDTIVLNSAPLPEKFITKSQIYFSFNDVYGEHRHFIDLNKVNFIVAYRKWDKIFYSDFVNQPGFE